MINLKDQTLGVNKEETTPSEPPADNKVPVVETEVKPSDQTLKPETETTADTTTVKPGGVDEAPAPSGRAAQRIGELIRKNKSLQEQLSGKGEDEPETPPTGPEVVSQDTPEYKRAKDFLKNLGFTGQEEVSKVVKEEISNLEARMILDSEKMRLESKYDGSDGRPSYDHEKVMKHARDTGIYNPEAAYENLFKPELLDWAIKQAQKAGSPTFTEKPTSSTTGESGQLDKESIARILSTPDGRKWYDENRTKILSALQRGEL